ncbi:hypothetical protein [Ursidibacter sp. B-7004-1]
MKELKINELSLVFGGVHPVIKGTAVVVSYIAGREVVDPFYDEVRENIVNTPVKFPLSVPVHVNVSPSWTEGRISNSSFGNHYMPGSSYPTKTSNTNQSGSDYGDGTDYQ